MFDVLIAEDSQQMRQYLRTVLEAMGAKRIREAADGSEARAAIEDSPPDLLLTDYQMAPVDGLDLILWARESASDSIRFMPIIMVTGCSERAQLMRVIDAGVNVILEKPVSPGVLVNAISGVLENPVPFIRARNYFGPDRRLNAPMAVQHERRVPQNANAA